MNWHHHLTVCLWRSVKKGVSEILCLIDNLQSHLTDNNRLSQILFIFLKFPAEALTLMLHAQKQRTVEHEVGNSSSRLKPVLFCEGWRLNVKWFNLLPEQWVHKELQAACHIKCEYIDVCAQCAYSLYILFHITNIFSDQNKHRMPFGQQDLKWIKKAVI